MKETKEKANVAVLVSGGGTNLQAIIDTEKTGKMPHCKIALVVSNKKDAYALKRAEAAGIPCRVIEKKKGQQEEFEQSLVSCLESFHIDMIVLAGCMSILSKDFTDMYSGRIINVHPSLIPSFCGKGYYGLKVHEAALSYGVKVTGATVHYVNEVPDGGKIILQKAVYVEDGDTPEILQRRVMEQAEWLILPQATELVAAKIIEEGK